MKFKNLKLFLVGMTVVTLPTVAIGANAINKSNSIGWNDNSNSLIAQNSRLEQPESLLTDLAQNIQSNLQRSQDYFNRGLIYYKLGQN